MVQTYGVAPDNDGDPTNHVAGDGEGSSLLGGDATPKRPARDGQATIVSCVSNLANTIIGSGKSIILEQWDVC